MTEGVRIARGGVYLPADVCAQVFAGLEAVVLVRRDEDLLVLPVRHAAAGGYLLKQRNLAGDRRVDAADFLRFEGIEDDASLDPSWVWDEAAAALRLHGVFLTVAVVPQMVSSAREPA